MSIRSQQWPWFAILVKTGTEKTATLFLENAGYKCFLPVARFISLGSDPTKECGVPLFPGYLFCRMDPHHRLPVLMTPGVVQIVGAGETPIPVKEQEVAALQRVGKSGIPIMPWPYLQVGHVARLDDGPLRGLTGMLIKIKSGLKLVLPVSLLQRSVAVEVERSWLSGAHSARHAAFDARSDRATPVPSLLTQSIRMQR
ncbi:MAG: NusG-like protein [Acidobacteria bacterium]|nr:MAG: NusG-like protein [Acidobacteriota bacterium]